MTTLNVARSLEADKLRANFDVRIEGDKVAIELQMTNGSTHDADMIVLEVEGRKQAMLLYSFIGELESVLREAHYDMSETPIDLEKI